MEANGAQQSTDELRQIDGIADSAPLPTGASIKAVPIAAEWKNLSPDEVQVSLLIQLTLTNGQGQQGYNTVSITSDAAWVSQNGSGDWKELTSNGPLPAPSVANVGTEAFNEAGWIALELTS